MRDVSFLFYLNLLCIFIVRVSYGSDDARRLYYDLLKGRKYNKLIRPVGNSSDKLTVRMGIRLSQLIDIVSTHNYYNSTEFLNICNLL